MTYRELLEYTANNPGCLQSSVQQKKESDNRYRQWVKKFNGDNRTGKKSKSENK
ncbi:MAG: hypothetical protein Q8920_16700 [Bacillota bacterium]|nr:hypothetical protein [Bacillota bacterium]